MTPANDTRSGEVELIERMARGDQDALAELIDELGGRAYSLALHVTRSTSLAEEAVQDSFVSCWRTAATFDPDTATASTWVLGIVRNKAVDRVRHEARRRPRTADGAAAAVIDVAQVDVEDSSTSADPVVASWAAARSIEVARAVTELSEQHREVLNLAYFRGLSQAEIAERLGVPLGTVKTRSLRALARLRDILTARGIEGSG